MAKKQNWSLDDDIKAALADMSKESSRGGSVAASDPYAGLHHSEPPATGLSEKIGGNDRQSTRYSVNWKIALIFDDQEFKPTYHGRTHDLSLTGTGMLTGSNLYATSPVIILLAPPPLHPGHRQKLIEIKARQQYVVYAGETRCWRLGFAFLEFKDDGFDVLKDRLRHHHPVTRVALVKPVF